MRLMKSLGVAVAVVLFAVDGARAQDVTLSVAVSLKEKQIEAGAPVDVFLSAAQRQMDELEKQNLIVKASRRVFARNALVVVKPADSRVDISKPADLIGARVVRIAIGNPKSVPAGQYAEDRVSWGDRGGLQAADTRPGLPQSPGAGTR